MKTVGLCFLFAILAAGTCLDLHEVYTPEELSGIDRSVLEDASLNFTQLGRKYGYPTEEHTLYTADGYGLTLHRIPYSKACTDGNRKVPVLVQHGLLSSSIDFIIMGPQCGLGYILADNCYDVWFGNARGNRHSRWHKKLKPKDPKFWEFSWHEMGTQDLPAVIDYILKETGQPSLHYVGHSQGTTQFFVFASTQLDYHNKIRSAHALAPVAFMKHLKSSLIQIASLLHKPIHEFAKLVGLHEFLPTCEFLNFIGREFCKDKYPFLQEVCSNVLFLLTGFDPQELNTTMLPALIAHAPAGAATRQIVHYAQEVLSGEFRQYDHGIVGNIVRYGSAVPPRYNVDRINVPVALYFGDNDWLADVDDVHRLSEILPNLIGRFRVHRKLFNHIDFLWGISAKSLVYDKLISIMNRY